MNIDHCRYSLDAWYKPDKSFLRKELSQHTIHIRIPFSCAFAESSVHASRLLMSVHLDLCERVVRAHFTTHWHFGCSSRRQPALLTTHRGHVGGKVVKEYELLTHVPPSPHLVPRGDGLTKSKHTTFAPCRAASFAAAIPPEPPPMTAKLREGKKRCQGETLLYTIQ